MNMVDKLLEQLKLRGLSVAWQSDQQLLLQGPTAEKTPAVLAAVKTFKRDLLERLRPRTLPPELENRPDLTDVHHPPPTNTNDGPETCVECKSHVWDREETAILCDRKACPMKRP